MLYYNGWGIKCYTIKCYQNMMVQTLSVGNFCYNKLSEF